jgi:hypothetical protein
MDRLISSPRTLGLLWLAVALSSTLLSTGEFDHLALGGAGALCALVLRQAPPVRVVGALAMVPAAIPEAPIWTFILAGGALAVTLARTSGATAVPSALERIQAHLEWCRRRDEPAHLLWVHAPRIGRETAIAALAAFRVTDAVALLHEGEGHEEIVAMVDDASFERDGLERRLRAHVGENAGFGWASFPQDGVTLDSLFHQARAAAVASTPERLDQPSAQLPGAFRRFGTRPPAGVPARSSNQG